MGHLVELGKIVFGLEMLAECSFAPPDTYEKKFVSNSFIQFQEMFKKMFQKMFQIMFQTMFQKISERKLTRKVKAALMNLAIIAKLVLGP